jgi:hypothetical protein
MSGKIVVWMASACAWVATAAYAGAPCDGASAEQYRDCVRLVDSLRPDKAGQMRVFASDGSEFTAGQALWMRGQMNKVARLCASHAPADQAEAERILAEVRELLRSHQRES